MQGWVHISSNSYHHPFFCVFRSNKKLVPGLGSQSFIKRPHLSTGLSQKSQNYQNLLQMLQQVKSGVFWSHIAQWMAFSPTAPSLISDVPKNCSLGAAEIYRRHRLEQWTEA